MDWQRWKLSLSLSRQPILHRKQQYKRFHAAFETLFIGESQIDIIKAAGASEYSMELRDLGIGPRFV